METKTYNEILSRLKLNDPNSQKDLEMIMETLLEKKETDSKDHHFYQQVLFSYVQSTLTLSNVLQQSMKKLFFKLQQQEGEFWCHDYMIHAAENGNIGMLKFGLQLGFSINSPSTRLYINSIKGETHSPLSASFKQVLHSKDRLRHVVCFKWLRREGGAFQGEWSAGSLMHIALAKPDFQVVDMLREEGVDINDIRDMEAPTR